MKAEKILRSVQSYFRCMTVCTCITLSFISTSLADSMRGWQHLTDQLYSEGVSGKELNYIFGEVFPEYEPVTFRLKPAEGKRMYREFYSKDRQSLAVDHVANHYGAYSSAERRYGVSPGVIAAILLVETHYGKNTGSAPILYRLARLANINSPANVKYNYKLLSKDDPTVTFSQVQKRGNEVSKIFLPEVLALLKIAKKHGYNPLKIKGSHAGAFGIPQFLPTSFINHGVDGDRDGKVSLYDLDDAIHSTAKFLSYYGWKPRLSRSQKYKVVWNYNHSDAYVNTVLDIAAEVERQGYRSRE
jgi:membrane-bound lytic murein transglycosylase B